MSWKIISAAANKLFQPRREAPPTSTYKEGFILPSAAIRQLDRLQLSASRFLPGYATGMRPSLRRKPAVDFHEHRSYIPGDDLRFVDWKASARQEHVFIRQGEQPKEATVTILVDCSASMSWGSDANDSRKQSAALTLAASLAYLALAHGDHLVLTPLSNPQKTTLGPISGKGQFPLALNYLRSLEFTGKIDLGQTVKTFSRNRAHPTGLVLLISDLLEVPELGSLLAALPAPHWDVVVLHLLHPQELEPTLTGNFELSDCETGHKTNFDIDAKALAAYQAHLKAWQQRLDVDCVENNAFYTVISAEWSLDKEILPHLREVAVVRPL